MEKKKKRRRGINCRTFFQNPRTRERSHHINTLQQSQKLWLRLGPFKADTQFLLQLQLSTSSPSSFCLCPENRSGRKVIRRKIQKGVQNTKYKKIKNTKYKKKKMQNKKYKKKYRNKKRSS